MISPFSAAAPALRRASRLAALVLTLALATTALPATAANRASIVVEGVQMPAWVERDGDRPVPLSPGMELRPNDQIKTGAGSRLLLRASDGSAIKLGENATFRLDALRLQPGNVFEAAMNVLEGAFRFTTDSFARSKQRRTVNIRIATVTAGVRGTDLWGKSEANKQVVCLIEGRIEVTPPGEAAITMDQPLQFYVRENGRSQPVATVPAEQLRVWAAQTEIEPGRGAMRRGGQWKITLGSADTQEAALKLYDEVRRAGYAATILPVAEGDQRAYLVRLANLSSKAEADALAARLKGRFGTEEPKVSM